MAKIQLNGKIAIIKTQCSILDLLKKYKLINKKGCYRTQWSNNS